MNDGPSNYSSLRQEWSLLVHSFLDHQPEEKNLNADDLSVEQVNLLQKDLSQKRKKLNQKIEGIKSRMDELHAISEILILVGSDNSEIQSELSQLNVDGEKISNEIFSTETKIKKTHELKEKMLTLTELDQAQ